jgi:hypothetical protein
MRMQQCQMIVLLFLNSMQVPWANSAILCPNAFLHESAVREKKGKSERNARKVCARQHSDLRGKQIKGRPRTIFTAKRS